MFRSQLDLTLQRILHGQGGSAEVVVAQNLTRIGIGVLLLAVVGLTGLAVRARWEGWVRRGSWAPVGVPLLAVAIASAAATVTKLVVHRARPPVDGWLAPAHGSSFPSGHTTAATAGYLALALVVAARTAGPAARLAVLSAGVAVSVAVGWTRLALGVHWPTDVLAGWVLGAAAACAAVTLWPRLSATRTVGAARRLPRRGGASPAAGAGVSTALAGEAPRGGPNRRS